MKKIPVDLDYVAHCISMRERGLKINHPCQMYFDDILYENINKMIHKICHKFSSYNWPEEDLFQECYQNLLDKISKYEIGCKFTTFAYTVTKNFLLTFMKRESPKRKILFSSIRVESMKLGINGIPSSYQNFLCNVGTEEIEECLKELSCRNPRNQEFVMKIFGDINKTSAVKLIETISIPTKLNKQDRRFFDRYIIPELEKRFETK